MKAERQTGEQTKQIAKGQAETEAGIQGQAGEGTGVYLHVPFCLQKCLYCDFCSFPRAAQEVRDAYVDALCRQIREQRTLWGRLPVDTVYFGGGTPTTLSLCHWERLFAALDDSFRLLPGAEITTEINPATADLSYLTALHSLGLNRLSIGVQSAQEAELRALGRIHDFSQAAETVALGRRAGFDNISMDLMLGIPRQTRESLHDTLERVLALSPQHLSAYLLKVEPGTPFGRMAQKGQLALPDEDAQCDMYLDTVQRLTDAGLSPYEISNFARPGCESRHNLRYWLGRPYLGLGLAAHSDFGGERYEATSVMEDYLAGRVTLRRRRIGETERKNEYLMLRLRLYRGFCKQAFNDRFQTDFDRELGGVMAPYVRWGYATDRDGWVALTPRGMLISNTILSELTDFSDSL